MPSSEKTVLHSSVLAALHARPALTCACWVQRACDEHGRVLESVRAETGELLSMHVPHRTASHDLVSLHVPVGGNPDLLGLMHTQLHRPAAPSAATPAAADRKAARNRGSGRQGRGARAQSLKASRSGRAAKQADQSAVAAHAEFSLPQELLDKLTAAGARVVLSTAPDGSTFCVVDSQVDSAGLLVVDVSAAVAAARRGDKLHRGLVGRTVFAAAQFSEDERWVTLQACRTLLLASRADRPTGRRPRVCQLLTVLALHANVWLRASVNGWLEMQCGRRPRVCSSASAARADCPCQLRRVASQPSVLSPSAGQRRWRAQNGAHGWAKGAYAVRRARRASERRRHRVRSAWYSTGRSAAHWLFCRWERARHAAIWQHKCNAGMAGAAAHVACGRRSARAASSRLPLPSLGR